MAALHAAQCQNCGHAYSTRFDTNAQPTQTARAQPMYATQHTQQVQPYPIQAQPYPPGQFTQVNNLYALQRPSAGLAITSMVLGIVSLFFWCLPLVAVLLRVLAIIFGFVWFKQNKGMSITGILCGGIHFIFWIGVFLIAALGAGAALPTVGPEAERGLKTGDGCILH